MTSLAVECRLRSRGRFVGRLGAVLLALTPVAAAAKNRWTESGYLTPSSATLANQKMITLPSPPEWDSSAPTRIWTIDDINAELARSTRTPPPVNFLRTSFVLPDHDWLVKFKKWFSRLEKPLKMRFDDQVWDCDNYANCFVAMSDLVNLGTQKEKGVLCIGWATVFYERPFAGIGRGPHAIVIVGTSEGLFIIEPQNGTMAALRDFPNRHRIEVIYF